MIAPMYFVHAQNGDTALIRASERGHVATVKVLLEHNAQMDLQNQVCPAHLRWIYCLFLSFSGMGYVVFVAWHYGAYWGVKGWSS